MVQRLPNDCRSILKRFSNGPPTTVQRLSNDCSTIVRRLYNDCTTIDQRLFNDTPTIVQRLCKGGVPLMLSQSSRRPTPTSVSMRRLRYTTPLRGPVKIRNEPAPVPPGTIQFSKFMAFGSKVIVLDLEACAYSCIIVALSYVAPILLVLRS